MTEKGFGGYLRDAGGGVRVTLRVSPGARRTTLDGPYGERALKLRVAAPPVDGKANAEVVRFLARRLGVESSRVSIVRGASARDKTVLVEGATPREVSTGLLGEGGRP